MNGFKNTTAQSGWQHVVRAVLFTGFLVLSTTSFAQANALQTEWNNFLAGGETEWAGTAAPPITVQIKDEIAQAIVQAEGSSDPYGSVWIQYLEWRRDLDPSRFDYYHPIEGPALAKLTPPASPSINPEPQKIANTPEPGTITLALALTGAGFWWRRGRRSAAAA